MNNWKRYLSSVHPSKRLWSAFLLDALFVTYVVLTFSFFGGYINEHVQKLSGGKTPEQLQQSLVTLSPEKLQLFLSDLKSFLFVFLGGLFVLILSSYLLFTLTQALIWSGLHNKSFHYSRWNVMVFITACLGLLYLLGFFIIKLGLAVFLQVVKLTMIMPILNQLLILLFVVFVFLFSCHVFSSYAQEPSVWRSVERAFHLLSWKHFLFCSLTLLILSLISWFTQKYLLFNVIEPVKMAVTIALFLLFLAWMRKYTLSA